jgi:riboflavin synthase
MFEARTLDPGDVAIGDSIAVAGACLTVVAQAHYGFAADLSPETLARTTLGRARAGDGVNLEKSLRLSDRLGGHLVSGHIDGIGAVADVVREGEGGAERWRFVAPPELLRYIAEKGSIAVDGVSLTVNGVTADGFHVTLIPHTLGATTFGERKAGDPVNLEVDMVARYLERLAAFTVRTP